MRTREISCRCTYYLYYLIHFLVIVGERATMKLKKTLIDYDWELKIIAWFLSRKVCYFRRAGLILWWNLQVKIENDRRWSQKKSCQKKEDAKISSARNGGLLQKQERKEQVSLQKQSLQKVEPQGSKIGTPGTTQKQESFLKILF